jgi:hypothetical protein
LLLVVPTVLALVVLLVVGVVRPLVVAELIADTADLG